MTNLRMRPESEFMSPGSAALPPSPNYPSILSPFPLLIQYNVERGYTKGFTVSTLSVGWEEGLGGCSLAAPRACNYVSLWNLNSTSNSPEGPRRLSCQISANQRDTETSANIKNHEKNVPKVMTSLLMSSPPISIRHLHISHSAPYLPPKIWHNLVLHFSWVLQLSQEKLKTMLMQNFGAK